MTDILHSKRTFSSALNAEKACKRDAKVFLGVHQLPSGRFCYVYEVNY